ncbi:MAG: dockerin type I repeat-containing protein [Planctomycetota bacterium]
MLHRFAKRAAKAALLGGFVLVGTAANAQVLTFQDGANGYNGTVDTEFRDTDPTNAFLLQETGRVRGNEIRISVDQADSDIPGQPGRTQGAIRFDNVIGNGAGQVAPGSEVLFADVIFYVRSVTAPDARVTLDRVLGADQGTPCSDPSIGGDASLCDPQEDFDRGRAPGVWREDDSWQSLGGTVFGVANPIEPTQAIIPFDPIVTSNNSAVLGPLAEATTSSEDPSNPTDGLLLEEFNTVANDFVSIEVTDSLRKYLAGEPNAGWAINSTSGNGWDVYSSDYSFATAGDFSEAEGALVAEYQDANGLNLTEVELRPQLRVVLGANGDINFDGSIDALDFETLRSRLGSRNPSRERGLNGDLNFDFDVDLKDFALFKDAFETANGAGSFALMVAGVPEPTTALLALASVALLPRRRS